VIQAIETSYAGCRFRSRLEARWAVFFDALGITWQYEPQGYMVGPGGDFGQRPYLPDFWFPESQAWAEVKGAVSTIDWNLLAYACDWDSGLPGLEESYGTNRGLLLLGPVPRAGGGWAHPVIQHRKGLSTGWMRFMPGYGPCYFSDNYPENTGESISTPCWDFQAGYGTPPPLEGRPVTEGDILSAAQVTNAYHAALSARFEYGQSGPYLGNRLGRVSGWPTRARRIPGRRS